MWLRFLIRNLGKSTKSPNPHIRPLRKVFEKTLRCFRTLYQSEDPRQMQDFKNETRGALLREKATLSQPAEFYNKSGAARCAKSNGCPSPGNPRHFPLENNFCFVAEVPLSSTFAILRLSAGDCRLDENRKPQPYLKSLSWRAGMRRR